VSSFNLISRHQGTFLPFNPITDLTLVTTYGYSAGNNSDGSKIYIGKGDNSAHLGLTSCPARISIDPAKPGAFMSSAAGENFDNKTAYFLASHPNLIWGTVNESTAWNYHYGIRMMSGAYPVMLARVNISGVTYVGRVRDQTQKPYEFEMRFFNHLYGFVTYF
jgi:hypothetical protein